MGALTVTTPYAKGGDEDVRAKFSGNLKLLPFTFVASTSYATGGDTIAAGSLPTAYKDLISPWAIGAPQGLGLFLDVANSKLKFYTANATGGAEVTNATNMQTTGLFGTGAVTVFFLVR